MHSGADVVPIKRPVLRRLEVELNRIAPWIEVLVWAVDGMAAQSRPGQDACTAVDFSARTDIEIEQRFLRVRGRSAGGTRNACQPTRAILVLRANKLLTSRNT